MQERWAREAAEALGDDPVPADHEMVGRLRYGDAVLRESMRLKAVASVSPYDPLVDTEIAGVRVPAGTRIVLPARYINGLKVRLRERTPGGRPQAVSSTVTTEEEIGDG